MPQVELGSSNGFRGASGIVPGSQSRSRTPTQRYSSPTRTQRQASAPPRRTPARTPQAVPRQRRGSESSLSEYRCSSDNEMDTRSDSRAASPQGAEEGRPPTNDSKVPDTHLLACSLLAMGVFGTIASHIKCSCVAGGPPRSDLPSPRGDRERVAGLFAYRRASS